MCHIEICVHICYTSIVKGETPRQIKAARSNGRQKGGKGMRYHMGMWYYQGKTYESLHEALVANWAK